MTKKEALRMQRFETSLLVDSAHRTGRFLDFEVPDSRAAENYAQGIECRVILEGKPEVLKPVSGAELIKQLPTFLTEPQRASLFVGDQDLVGGRVLVIH